MVLAALVSAGACVAARRAVPWQGRQAAIVMAVAMLALAVRDVPPGTGLLLGAILVVSAMIGTVGVRGTRAAAACCHRALASLAMAMCAFQGASTDHVSASVAHTGHGFTGVLAVIGVVGVAGVVLWTIVTEWFVECARPARTARLLAIESWAMSAGLVVMGWPL